MANSTPGPWFCGDEDEDIAGVQYVDVHAGTYGDPSYRSVAHVEAGFDDDFLPLDEETHANAHLIAAAPELLEALQALAAFVDETCAYVDANPLLDAARAAIAKATQSKDTPQ